ncbi:MAG: hypothetical protein RI907_3386 [Pseudomonadota bacterium]|jgi:phosphinothricin acetyltransferase
MLIRPFAPGDEAGIAELYNHYILNTTVTFEEVPLTPQAMRERIDAYRAHHPWLVAEDGGQIVGYAYGSRFHARAAFRHTAEVSVYVRDGHERRGIARALYAPLIAFLGGQGVHAVLAVISLPHEASVGLHEALGFEPKGRLTEVGFKFGRWLDIGYWQLNLVGSAV